ALERRTLAIVDGWRPVPRGGARGGRGTCPATAVRSTGRRGVSGGAAAGRWGADLLLGRRVVIGGRPILLAREDDHIIGDYFAGIAILAFLVLPLTSLQAALDIDAGAFGEVLVA